MKVMLAALLLLSSNILSADRLGDILNRYSQTIGSIEAWKEIKSITYKLDIKESSFSVKATYRATRSGKMRIDIFAGGQHVFTEAYDGHNGWQWQQGESEPKVIEGKASAALRHGIELPGRIYTLMDMQKNGHELEFVREEEWQGIPAYLLGLRLKDGHQKFYVLEQKTGIVLANRDKRAFHPDIDNTEVMVETRLTDYREVNGMKRSFSSENWDLTNNKSLGTTKVLELLLNSPIEDSFFVKETFQVL